MRFTAQNRDYIG